MCVPLLFVLGMYVDNQEFTFKYPAIGTGTPELQLLRALGVTGPRA